MRSDSGKGKPETYGELVKRLAAEEGFSAKEEEVLRLVFGLVPLSGEKTTQGRIEQAIKAPKRGQVGHCVDLLKDGGLVSAGLGGPKRWVWREIPEYRKEHDLYEPMRAEIRTRWADESPHDYDEPDRFCEVLGSHGAKRGRWGAPDITLIGGKTLPFLPGKFLDVVTFEVKPSLDITGLYEALSHRTHATHAYLICHHAASESEPEPRVVGRISREAQRTGVGFILARQPNDYGTWEEIAPATRWRPEPEELHDFIVHLGKTDRNVLRCLRRWLRRDPFLGPRPEVDFSSLDLDGEERRIAEDIYFETPVDGRESPSWKHFKGWIGKPDVVERVREKLKKAGVIRVVRGGGMRLPKG